MATRENFFFSSLSYNHELRVNLSRIIVSPDAPGLKKIVEMLVRVFVNVNNEITNSEMRSLLTDQSVQCYNSVIIPALSH